MKLVNWFNTSAGQSLQCAEDRLLSRLFKELAGEVLVFASLLNRCEAARADAGVSLKVVHSLDWCVRGTPLSDPQVVGRLSGLPYRSGSVNAFVLQHGLETERDQLGSIGEISRVLASGGRAFVLTLEPWGGVGIRCLLGKLTSLSLMSSLAIDSASLMTARALQRAFAREGLDCERQHRVYGNRVMATLTELRKQSPGADVQGREAREPFAEDLGLVGVTSRTSRSSEA